MYHFFLSGFQHTWHATPTLWSPSSFSTFMTCRWNIAGAFLFPCNSLSNCQYHPHSPSLSILDHVEWFLAVDAGVEKRHVNVVQTADFCSASILNCSVLASTNPSVTAFNGGVPANVSFLPSVTSSCATRQLRTIHAPPFNLYSSIHLFCKRFSRASLARTLCHTSDLGMESHSHRLQLQP